MIAAEQTTLFFTLFLKLVPLYISAIFGFIAARLLRVDARSVAVVVFYLLMPIVIGFGASRTPISFSLVSLPVVTFCFSTFLCFLFYLVGKCVWRDATPNILGLMAGTGNIGYFGLTLAAAVLDSKAVGLYIAAMLGPTIFESSIGFFLTARGHHSIRECIIKVIRLPSLYAFIAGCLISKYHIPVPDLLVDFSKQAQSAYTMLGMMMVGFGLAHLSRKSLNGSFLWLALFSRFIAWPGSMLLFITLDKYYLHWYSASAHHALFTLSIVPLAANSVAIATLLNLSPARVAFAVVLSTLMALVYVPLMIMVFL